MSWKSRVIDLKLRLGREPNLHELIDLVAGYIMTDQEMAEQAQSWVRGEMAMREPPILSKPISEATVSKSGIVKRDRTVYITSDGEEYLNSTSAVIHEKRVQLDKFLNNESVGRGGEWTQQMFGDFIFENQSQLIEILTMKLED